MFLPNTSDIEGYRSESQRAGSTPPVILLLYAALCKGCTVPFKVISVKPLTTVESSELFTTDQTKRRNGDYKKLSDIFIRD